MRPALPSLLLLLAASDLAGQAVLTGTVRDDSTGRPLAGVEVVVEALGRRALTDVTGRYILDGLPAGLRLVLVRHLGYHPFRAVLQLAASDTVRHDVSLERMVVELEPLVVTEQPPGPRGLGVEAFEERRRLGFGRFIDSTELRRLEHLRLPDALNRHTGIQFGGAQDGSIIAVSRRRYGPMGEPCCMQVVVDGVVLYRSVAPTTGNCLRTERVLAANLLAFDVAHLEAVEVYRSAGEVPTEFGGAGAACGVVVLWTKRR